MLRSLKVVPEVVLPYDSFPYARHVVNIAHFTKAIDCSPIKNRFFIFEFKNLITED